jgi:hypothetical protein
LKLETRGVTITLTVNANASRLSPGAYGPAVAFTNVSNGKGSTTRLAKLTIQAPSSPRATDQIVPNGGSYLLNNRGGYLLDDRSVARDAYRDFGEGSGHPAKLNFGDCFAYALAKLTGEPLLFKGDEFAHTDIRPAATER